MAALTPARRFFVPGFPRARGVAARVRAFAVACNERRRLSGQVSPIRAPDLPDRSDSNHLMRPGVVFTRYPSTRRASRARRASLARTTGLGFAVP
jgi:hypothetical protein